MKREKAGFTLAELLVVVAIIGVLVAVAIPVFGGALDKAREAACAANCRSLKGELTTLWLTTDGSDADKEAAVETAFDAAKNAGGICPSGGTISYELDIKDGAVCGVTVSCTVHSATVEQKVLTEFGAIVGNTSVFEGQANPSYCASNNDELRAYYFENNAFTNENGEKTWPTKVFAGKTYYIQPYYNQESKKIVIYANENKDDSGTNRWAAKAIYMTESISLDNGKTLAGGWYYAPTNGSINVANQTISDLAEEIAKRLDNTKEYPYHYWQKLN